MRKNYRVLYWKLGLSMMAMCMSVFAFSQTLISGVVTSQEDNEGLPGVTIVVKGTAQGTVTDVNGSYKINVPSSESVLIFSFVGHESQEIVAGGQSVINLALNPDVTSLDEVIVVGYGTQQKKNITGSVATVLSQDLERVPVLNPLDMLGGRAAGVSITSSSGMPNASPQIFVRGVRSPGRSVTNSLTPDAGNENDFQNVNQPIYVIDGLITTGINNISPNDIASVSILKDASAAAIYGARASNGVIIITTKRGGNAGRPVISFNTFVGTQNEGNLKRKLLNSDQYIEIFNESYENGGVGKQWTDEDLDLYKDANGDYIYTDWKDLIKRTGVVQNYELSVRGGNDRSSYYVSAGYKDNKLMVKSYDFNKYTVMFNSDHKINDWIKFGNSLNLYQTTTNGLTAGLGETYWQAALTQVPIKGVYEDDGSWWQIRNPYLENGGNLLFSLQNNIDEVKNTGLMGNLYLTIEPAKGLQLTARQSLEWDNRFYTQFRPGLDASVSGGNTTTNQITKDQRQTMHRITDFTLDYTKAFGDHNASALIGYSIEEWEQERLRAFRAGTPNNSIQYVGSGDPSTATNDNNFYDWAFLSTFGRLNYDYKGTYLVGLNIRRDGSSRLAAGNRFGTFPSVSMGWRLSNEAFMNSVTLINDLKVRASYGTLGNVQSLGRYETFPSLNSYVYSGGQSVVPGYTFDRAINSDIIWESTLKKNIGVDATLWDHHVYTNIDFFVEETKDLLIQRPIPPSTGKVNDPFINVGDKNNVGVRNQGVELLIGYVTTVKDWNFDVSFNWSTFKNEITYVPEGSEEEFLRSGIQVGSPIRSFFGFKSGGIIDSQEKLDDNPQYAGKALGDILFLDVNSRDENGDLLLGVPDGVVDDDDRTLIGNKYPKNFYGMTASVGYKTLTLQVQLQGVSGLDRDIATENDYGLMHYYQRWALNHDAMILDRWNPENPDGKMPRVDISDAGKNRRLSDFWLRDASYLRIKNINLNYSFPESITDKLNMAELAVYVSVQNLWTFTKFPGQEVDSTVDPITGVPQPRTSTLGLRVTF